MATKQATADDVRRFVRQHYIESARKVGQSPITIRTGHVHAQMGLVNRMPLICSALQAELFGDAARVALVTAVGPNPGSNLWLTFDVLP